jgi:hypothetical protein
MKTTMLAWLARLGATPQIRKFLGYHVDPSEVVMATYGRDNAAEPLRQLEKALAAVRLNLFLPDETRSGTVRGPLKALGFQAWVPGASAESDSEEEELRVSPTGEADDEVATESEPVDEDSSSSGASSEDPDDLEADGAAAQIGNSLAPMKGCSEAEIASGVVFFHSIFTTIHKLRHVDANKFKCGRALRVGYRRVEQSTFDWPKCKVCFPPA